MTDWAQAIYAIVARIPEGSVSTYGTLARLVPVPRGARGVGSAMARCPTSVPWWRVVAARGVLTAPDAATQREILQAEGVPFLADGRVDLGSALWPPADIVQPAGREV
jgi:methylated-DNA-protein-cysteine methyltransferase-like protein